MQTKAEVQPRRAAGHVDMHTEHTEVRWKDTVTIQCHVAPGRREKLRFPSGTATAQIIRTLFGIDADEPAEAVANMRTGIGGPVEHGRAMTVQVLTAPTPRSPTPTSASRASAPSLLAASTL